MRSGCVNPELRAAARVPIDLNSDHFFRTLLGLLLLVSRFSRLAAWGIIVLLIAVFPANIYLYRHQDIMPGSPVLHLLRLPLQAAFILWAFWHTRRDSPAAPTN
jgi:uncharacterized membrane protein